MGKFETAYSSVQGNLHVLRDIPNQDFVELREIDNHLVVSIADGHGSDVCFRSDLGAQFAVNIANDIIEKDLKEGTVDFKAIGEYGKRLARQLSEGWSQSVLKHLKENAFTDEEVDALGNRKKTELGHNAQLAYGTTLMSLVINEEHILVVNIGDAEMLLKLYGKDDVIIFNQNKRIGNETESLALPDAYKYFEVQTFESNNIEALLAATDGYPNSFKREAGYIQVIDDLIGIAHNHGIEAVRENLPLWLKDTSKQGSGDDITACFVHHVKDAE